MNTKLKENKYLELCNWLKTYKRVIVAFSGGVDSALVLYASINALGRENVIGIIADSASLSRNELKKATDFCNKISAQYDIVKTNELDIPGYVENSGARCYFCKSTLYLTIRNYIYKNNLSNYFIVDGTNLDDLNDIRPGTKAASEAQVLHPLVETKIDKQTVRLISRELSLDTAEKPAMACLSSRVALGDQVTREKLQMIEEAEEILNSYGFIGHRVRTHEVSSLKKSIIARIELSENDIKKFSQIDFSDITKSIKNLGFDFVVLDLEGYRMGGKAKTLKVYN